MAFEMQLTSRQGKASQQLVPFLEIRDGVVVMPDGTMRATLMASSLNFALKSEEEQNAIIFAFQDFLNSLDFPVQLTIVSRKLDITPYLEELRARREQQRNDLLKLQMDEYMNFIGELVKGSDIMTKTFYVTVSFSVQQSRKETFLERILKGFKRAARRHTLSDVEFTHYKTQLLQRVEQAAVGLRSIGLRLVPLQTQELLELYYNLYNPVTSRYQRLYNIAQLRLEDTEPHNLASQGPRLPGVVR